MAFMILTEEQIALLTEDQKARYERDLAIYLEREAFVRQIEKYEDVVLPPIKPKLEPIPAIVPFDTPEIAMPEHSVSVPKAAVVPPAGKLPEAIDAAVTVRGMPVVTAQTPQINKPELEIKQSDVPTVSLPTVEEYKYESPAARPVAVPEPLHIQTPAVQPVAIEAPCVSVPPVAVEQTAVPKPGAIGQTEVKVPNVTPAVQAEHLQTPVLPGEITLSGIPSVSVDAAPAAAVQMPQPAPASVPAVSVPDAPALTVQPMAGPASVEMPQVSVTVPAAPDYTAPDMAQTTVPTVKIPSVPKPAHLKTPVMTELPKTAEVRTPDIPTVRELQGSLKPGLSALPLTVEVKTPIIPDVRDLQGAMTTDVPRVSAPAAPSVPEVHAPVVGELELPKTDVRPASVDQTELAELLKLIQRKE